MDISELAYPVIILDQDPGGIFSILENVRLLETTTPLTIARGSLQRSIIVDTYGRQFAILSATLSKPRNIILRALDWVCLNSPVEIDVRISEPATISPEELGDRVRRAMDNPTFRDLYEEVGFDVEAFDEFRRSAKSVGAIIQYVIDHSKD